MSRRRAKESEAEMASSDGGKSGGSEGRGAATEEEEAEG